MAELFGDIIGEMRCGDCGRKVNSWHTKCPRCGTKFEGNTLISSSDSVTQYRKKCQMEIEKPVTAKDFQALKNYIDDHGGWKDELIPLERIFYNRNDILKALEKQKGGKHS